MNSNINCIIESYYIPKVITHEYVAKYNAIVLAHRNKYDDRIVEFAYEFNNKKLIRICGFVNWEFALIGAVKNGDLSIVKDVLKNGPKYIEFAAETACINRKFKIFKFFAENYEQINLYEYNFSAGYGGSMDIINYIIKKIEFNADEVIAGICTAGNFELLKSISGEWPFWGVDNALRYACFGGNIKCVDFIIEKGAKDFDKALYTAVASKKMDVVNHIIGKCTEEGINYVKLNFSFF